MKLLKNYYWLFIFPLIFLIISFNPRTKNFNPTYILPALILAVFYILYINKYQIKKDNISLAITILTLLSLPVLLILTNPYAISYFKKSFLTTISIFFAVIFIKNHPKLEDFSGNLLKAAYKLRYAIILTSFFSITTLTLLRAYSFVMGADAGLMFNVFWNARNGYNLYSSVLGYSYLAGHFSPIFYLISFLGVFPPFPYFIIFASLCLFLTFFIVIKFAKSKDAIGLIMIFLLTSPMWGYLIIHDISINIIILIPILLLCFYFFSQKKYFKSWFFLIIALLCKEEAGITIISFGLLYLVPKKQFKQAIAVVLVCSIYLISYFFILAPALRSSDSARVLNMYYDNHPIINIVKNNANELIPGFWLSVLLPFIILFNKLEIFLIFIPILYLSGAQAYYVKTIFYKYHWSILLFAVFFIMQRKKIPKFIPLAWLIFFVTQSFIFGPMPFTNSFAFIKSKHNLISYRREQRLNIIPSIIKSIPKDKSLTVSSRFLLYSSDRKNIFIFHPENLNKEIPAFGTRQISDMYLIDLNENPLTTWKNEKKQLLKNNYKIKYFKNNIILISK